MNLGTPIATGNTAKIYLYKDKAVKVFNDDLPESVSVHEAYKQNYAYSCGLNVPEVLDVTKINGKQAIIMEYVKGKTIGDLLLANKKRAKYYLSISVKTQCEVHENSAVSIEAMDKKLSRQIVSARQLDQNQKSRLLEILARMSYKSRLCHGDFHLDNLLMSNGKVTIIDWIDSTAGDIRADVYRTYLLYLQFSVGLADMYLQLYCEKSGLSESEIFKWAPIIAGARLSENVPSEQREQLIKIVNDHLA